MAINAELVKLGLHCKCPKCGQGDLYKPGLTLTLRQACPVCGLDFSRNDSADGPAVFLIFILGSLLVPLALIVDALFAPPLWVHALLWGGISIGFTLLTLRPLKAFIIALQYKYRPGDWDKT